MPGNRIADYLDVYLLDADPAIGFGGATQGEMIDRAMEYLLASPDNAANVISWRPPPVEPTNAVDSDDPEVTQTVEYLTASSKRVVESKKFLTDLLEPFLLPGGDEVDAVALREAAANHDVKCATVALLVHQRAFEQIVRLCVQRGVLRYTSLVRENLVVVDPTS